MTNQINAKGIYNQQIEELLNAIKLLNESDNKFGFVDDGSGEEYTKLQHQIGKKALSEAIDNIAKAQMVLIGIEKGV